MANELTEQIQVVARARQKAEETALIIREAMAKWDEEHTLSLNTAKLWKEEVVTQEARLRELTIAAYKETGNKKPAPEVGIREVEKLEYDPNQAMAWAVEHKMALKLDVPAYEKIVKATPFAFPLVRIEKVATATIASEIKIIEESK